MDLVLYNLDYTDKIKIDTDNLLNLLVFNGLKLKAGLDIYFNGTKMVYMTSLLLIYYLKV